MGERRFEFKLATPSSIILNPNQPHGRSADVPVGTANEKANEKAVNDTPLTSHSPAGEDASVPSAGDAGSADVPVGTANEKANEEAVNDTPLALHSLAGEDASAPRAGEDAGVPGTHTP